MRFPAELAITMQPRDITKSLPRGVSRKTRSPGAGWLSFLAFALVLTSLSTPANSVPVPERNRTPPLSTREKPAGAPQLTDFVAPFASLGEKDDPHARGQYFRAKGFSYL